MKKFILLILTMGVLAMCTIAFSGCNEKTQKPAVGTGSSSGDKENNGNYPVDMTGYQHIFKDEIVISAFWPPMMEFVNDTQFKYMQDAYIDLMEYNSDPIFNDKDSVEKMLTLCEKYNIYVTLYDNESNGWLNISDKKIQEIANNWKDRKGVVGFYLRDEPLNANGYGRVTRAITSVFPGAICQMNMLPAGALEDAQGHAEDWISAAGLGSFSYLSYDQYPFGLEAGSRPSSMYGNMNMVRKVGLKYGVDTACYLQSISNYAGFRDPTVDETRYHASAALAYGFKNLKYFTWMTPVERSERFTNAIINADGTLNARYSGIVDINKNIKEVSPILGKTDAVYVYHTNLLDGATEKIPQDYFIQSTNKKADAIVSLMVDRYDGTNYVMIVNKDFQKEQALEFEFSSIKGLKEVTDGVEADVKLNDNKLSITIPAGDFKLYKIISDENLYEGYKDDNKDNLAQGKPVFTSNSLGENHWYAYRALDGIRFSSGVSNGFKISKFLKNEENYFMVDLKRKVEFNRVDVYPATDKEDIGLYFPAAYDVYVSEDGKNFEKVASYKRDGEALTEIPSHKFDTVKMRYVKIVFTEAASENTVEISEVEIYNDSGNIKAPEMPEKIEIPEGSNLALNKKTKASSDVGQWGWSKDNITDGNLETGWSSAVGNNKGNPFGEEWISIDLKTETEFNRICVYPRFGGGSYFPAKYEILVSNDNKTFTSVYVQDNTVAYIQGNPNIIKLDGIKARYVRLKSLEMTQIETSPDGYLFQLGEVEIYNVKE